MSHHRHHAHHLQSDGPGDDEGSEVAVVARQLDDLIVVYYPGRHEEESRLTIKRLTAYDAMNGHSKEERQSKEKRTKKEKKKIEEKLSLSTRGALTSAPRKRDSA